MTFEDQRHWDARYRAGKGPVQQTPNRWLLAHADLVDLLAQTVSASGETPASLDVACGTGGTVLWLSARGWTATGVDLSTEALRLARSTARRLALAHRSRFLQADLDSWRPAPAQFHLVTNFYFLNRPLLAHLRDAVKPGGLFVMETLNHFWQQVKPTTNPDHLLQPDELAETVHAWGWEVVDLRSAGPETGVTTDAVVARKPYS